MHQSLVILMFLMGRHHQQLDMTLIFLLHLVVILVVYGLVVVKVIMKEILFNM